MISKRIKLKKFKPETQFDIEIEKIKEKERKKGNTKFPKVIRVNYVTIKNLPLGRLEICRGRFSKNY